MASPRKQTGGVPFGTTAAFVADGGIAILDSLVELVHGFRMSRLVVLRLDRDAEFLAGGVPRSDLDDEVAALAARDQSGSLGHAFEPIAPSTPPARKYGFERVFEADAFACALEPLRAGSRLSRELRDDGLRLLAQFLVVFVELRFEAVPNASGLIDVKDIADVPDEGRHIRLHLAAKFAEDRGRDLRVQLLLEITRQSLPSERPATIGDCFRCRTWTAPGVRVLHVSICLPHSIVLPTLAKPFAITYPALDALPGALAVLGAASLLYLEVHYALDKMRQELANDVVLGPFSTRSASAILALVDRGFLS